MRPPNNLATRETARKKSAQGVGSDEDVFASSWEDASNITEATKNSGASVRNTLKKKRAVKATSRSKQTRFEDEEV